jgi:mono/diheme cytochrome c family protein
MEFAAMTRSQMLLAACAAALTAAVAVAQTTPKTDAPRAQLLYSTHCIGCHTAQVHWRDKKLATDWTSLRAQVRRWQANTSLGWSDEEIVEVTRYLNARYYHFQPPRRQTEATPPMIAGARANQY